MSTKFGKWTVVKIENHFRVCRCECGLEKRVRIDSLTSGSSRSCGTCRPRSIYSAGRTASKEVTFVNTLDNPSKLPRTARQFSNL